jgi:phage baseplate assembly protein W
LTNRRERIFAPNFGADIRKRLFEQISQDTADELKMSIVTQVENYFPNVRVRELLVEGSPSTGTIRIRFSYSIVNTNEEDVLLVDIQNQ